MIPRLFRFHTNQPESCNNAAYGEKDEAQKFVLPRGRAICTQGGVGGLCGGWLVVVGPI